MEHGACNVIYIDRRANDEHVRRESLSNSLATRTSTGSVPHGYFNLGKSPPAEVQANVETLLSTFNEGMFSTTSSPDKFVSDLNNSSHLRIWALLPR